MEILELSADQAMEEIRWIKWLLMQFSPEWRDKVTSGELDALVIESIQSQQNIVCMATDHSPHGPAAMYMATVMPAMLVKVLYVHSVVVAMSYRGIRLLENHLIPHMKELAQKHGCTQINLTSSKINAQKIYRRSGFNDKATTHFRLYV